MRQPDSIDLVELLRPLHDCLIELLEQLDPSDWRRPTPAPKWTVKDVAAHLLDGDVRRLSAQRDGQTLPVPTRGVADYDALVEYLNGLNATWTEATRRMSPRVILDFLRLTGPQLCDLLESLDPDGQAIFGVAWAGQEHSPNWFDIAREYTEKWHHQQQIRMAVEAPLLTATRWVRPALDTFVRGVPHAYKVVGAPEGCRVVLEITGEAGGTWTLIRKGIQWVLFVGETDSPTARVRLPSDVAWRIFSRMVSVEDASQAITVVGDRDLGIKVLDFVGFMV